jgi:hypothetical protein
VKLTAPIRDGNFLRSTESCRRQRRGPQWGKRILWRDRPSRLAGGSQWALKAIGQAFDVAWQDIAATFGDNPHDIEHARLKLANAVLSIVGEDSRDVAVLKRAALQRMALDYRRRDDVSFAGEKLAKAKVPREKV